jgi:hypothetical protein
MESSDKIFVDCSQENVFARRRDGSCLRLLGDDGSFEELDEEERIQFLEDECEELDADEIYDGGFILELLDAVQNAGLDFAMKCPKCGTVLHADNACFAYTPSPSVCPYPDSSAVCISCNREICFCGDEGWFDEEFNQIALATLERIRTPAGEEFFRKIDESQKDIRNPGDSRETGQSEAVLWRGSMYDLVWGEEDFCRTYRRSLNIDEAKMSRNSEIAYDFICAVGTEIR